MKEVLSSNDITFAYVEITGGMFPLKKFLKLRDTHPDFESVRAEGRVGIPCIEVDDQHVFFDPRALDFNWLKE